MKKKATGGRRKAYRERRDHEKDSFASETQLGSNALVSERVRGGGFKLRLKAAEYVNLAEAAGKVTKAKILVVKNNPASRDYQRRGVITKGAILETDKGLAKVVSRPGQDGVVNAVLQR